MQQTVLRGKIFNPLYYSKNGFILRRLDYVKCAMILLSVLPSDADKDRFLEVLLPFLLAHIEDAAVLSCVLTLAQQLGLAFKRQLARVSADQRSAMQTAVMALHQQHSLPSNDHINKIHGSGQVDARKRKKKKVTREQLEIKFDQF